MKDGSAASRKGDGVLDNQVRKGSKLLRGIPLPEWIDEIVRAMQIVGGRKINELGCYQSRYIWYWVAGIEAEVVAQKEHVGEAGGAGDGEPMRALWVRPC